MSARLPTSRRATERSLDSRRSADFQVCCTAGFQTCQPLSVARVADLEIGDTADLEVCARAKTNAPRFLPRFFLRTLVVLSLTWLWFSRACSVYGAPKDQSAIITVGQDGRLGYDVDEQGNRIPDFSYCGYEAGDKQIPNASVVVVVEPKSGDNTTRIQQAIDYVAGLPLDQDGLRGAVLLLKGRHEVAGGLRVATSGIVLRGQGMGEDGTILLATGLDRRTLIRIIGKSDRARQTNDDWIIQDDYLPVGTTRFKLREASGLKVGDGIHLIRPSTQEWIDRLGATEFGGGIGGGWKAGSRDITWDRVIKAIEGNLVILNAPITTAIEKTVAQTSNSIVAQASKSAVAQVSKPASKALYYWPGRISHVGVENLQLDSAFAATNPKDENHSWCAITMENAENTWVRQVTAKHFAGSMVAIYESCKQVTVQDCLSLAPVSEIGGYRRHTFFTMGQQTLFLRCYAEHGRHDFSVGHCAAGPNAFVQCEAHQALDDSGPIESWASGVLYDNVIIDGNALSLGYRPGNNAGIGWAAANSVLWNCSASVIRCWNPPGAQNWSFGSWASFEGDGVWRSSNDFMKPASLFAGQLKDRLGAEVKKRLELMPRSQEESSNPSLDKAQELAAASHSPAPQLKDYIANAFKRDLIPSEPGNAHFVQEITNPKSEIRNLKAQLLITNGWLTCDGKLLIGGSANVAWWRGNVRPDEAASFGIGLTRFGPGRTGTGFTDDLKEVAESLVANGKAALDHNYGLWYDRRRDDHERIRRMNGDVLPPFYEQPFARSGQGTAWDGLSKYDLTRFNPWYWSRLQEFANLCEDYGLVLFHQNYFQHNILEAGAHWADCPWRSANNISETDFPEPPPYAGDKRIFMAELFYDVTHPVRRQLHRRYIRQCLNNFTDNPNVIQFTSAEFTGPTHFMEFWLDTIAEWERDNAGSSRREEAHSEIRNSKSEIRNSQSLLTSAATRPIIALSATKDVQDAVLADTKRNAIVDVIDFRYWWRTDQGEFAPPGGKNLSPRQFERQWHGGRPTDASLAQMAAEYRQRYPTKPVICNFESAGWAWLCAGGSMPRLPKKTDARLLAAIPHMTPSTEGSGKNRRLLREAGKQLLVYLGSNRDLDLSSETGSFRVNVVNPKTGGLIAGETVKAGGKVKLPTATIVWLVKEGAR